MVVIPPNRILEWRLAEYAETRRTTAALIADDLEDETRALSELAAAIAQSLGQWREKLMSVELARPMDMRRAGEIVLETLFDELLEPPAWSLLAAIFAVTETAQ